jgi:3-oxoacyl-[acyl-carrier-protein] synthase-3
MSKIIGVGHYVPKTILKNESITDSPEWVEEVIGIRERRFSITSTSDLATKAARKAMKKAGVDDVDVVILATATPDMIAPSTASIVKRNLGITGAAFDINAVCSGFLYGMILAHSLLESGAGTVLVIGADTFTEITDFKKRDCVFFGDGAGAVVMTKGNNMQSALMLADNAENGFSCEHEDTFEMNGKLVYQEAVRLVPDAINRALKAANMTIDDIDYMVPHQPSKRILHDIADKIGLPREKVLMNMDRYANTSAGPIPILLSESWKRFKKGDNILFAAIGAGWTYGAIIYEI